MVLVKADKNTEAGVLPDQKLLTLMARTLRSRFGSYSRRLTSAPALTPELKEQEERLRVQAEKLKSERS